MIRRVPVRRAIANCNGKPKTKTTPAWFRGPGRNTVISSGPRSRCSGAGRIGPGNCQSLAANVLRTRAGPDLASAQSGRRRRRHACRFGGRGLAIQWTWWNPGTMDGKRGRLMRVAAPRSAVMRAEAGLVNRSAGQTASVIILTLAVIVRTRTTKWTTGSRRVRPCRTSLLG